MVSIRAAEFGRTGGVSIGNSDLTGPLPGGVKYYDYPGAPLVESKLVPGRGLAPAPYGDFDLTLADANGGWIGSAVVDGFRTSPPEMMAL